MKRIKTHPLNSSCVVVKAGVCCHSFIEEHKSVFVSLTLLSVCVLGGRGENTFLSEHLAVIHLLTVIAMI